MDNLTAREQDILGLIAAGLSNQSIAEELVLSVGTVKWYNKQIFSKLNVSNRTQATLRAREMGLIAGEEAAAPTPVLRHNLPVHITPFIGREHELAMLHDLFERERLVNIIGPGGIGKTRLAIDFATRYGRLAQIPVWFVPLASLTNPDDALYAIADALGFTLRNSDDLRQPLLDFLSRKRLLLVLDNFEHILSAGELALAILQAAPDLRILVTSRAHLNIYGEVVLALKGLDFDESSAESDAVRLFIDRAWRGQAQHVPGPEEINSAIEICHMVDGLPLAVELAASWAHALPVTEIATQIRQGIDILRSSQQGLDDRHRSMRAVFEHTWNGLSEIERAALMRLSVFRGGFESDAASVVADASFDVLAALTGHSVIWRDESGRYYIHQLLRQYAAERLENAGLTDATYQRHVDFLIDLVERLGPFYGEAKCIIGANVLRVEHEIGNLRELVSWSLCYDRGYSIAQLIPRCLLVFRVRGRSIEALEWMLAVRAKLTDGDLALQVRVEAATAYLAIGACRYEFVSEMGPAAVELARQAGDCYHEGSSLFSLAEAWMHLYDYEQAEHCLNEGIRVLGDQYPLSVLVGVQFKALVAEMRHDWETALHFSRESFERSEVLGVTLPDFAVNYGRILRNYHDSQKGVAILKLAFTRAIEGGYLIFAITISHDLHRMYWTLLDDATSALQLSIATNRMLETMSITWVSHAQEKALRVYRRWLGDAVVDEAVARAEHMTADDAIAMTQHAFEQFEQLSEKEVSAREIAWMKRYKHYMKLL